MKIVTKLITIVLFLLSSFAFSQELVYKPVNPFFGGNNPFGYQQILASANAQNDFQEEGQDPFQQPSDLENFTNSLNRQLLNSLSQDLFQEQFGDQGLTVGTYVFGSLVVEVTPTSGGLSVNILNTQTGEQTQIIIPNN
ncbi:MULTISPECIES: curli assembly protein CsgF [Tenacibaculum]|uniref:Curli production assembly/transport component CsgF n=2 Tax=Tenacibaculum TaxID=104267 RepID=A0A9X4ER65_9FLAO|nr:MULTISPECIES: curli assembly protein CsgF [Tenacibaculum]AZJ34114.1 curli assembly protein CsgF [Tenacibaculum singaporense]MDE1207794.1 curli assembly protein CsgF [Tenacibaculum larymnensis]RLK07142.1 curli production assembly/transport component CsgF [Tenacibaculum discolor]